MKKLTPRQSRSYRAYRNGNELRLELLFVAAVVLLMGAAYLVTWLIGAGY